MKKETIISSILAIILPIALLAILHLTDKDVDKYEFLVDVKNTGTINATLDDHELSTTGRNDVVYTVKEIVDDVPTTIDWDDFDLTAGQTRTLLVSVVFDKELANSGLISTASVIDLTLSLNYVQA